jgi:hypothetical protein
MLAVRRPCRHRRSAMRALEDLTNEVRDTRSRDRLAEAVRAYQSGALRPAIIATWVAVALDLVNKIRELADLGEPAAMAYVKELDGAIAAQSPKALARLERELLDRCRDEFEFIEHREHIELTRLLDDRHVCAHPGFVRPEGCSTPRRSCAAPTSPPPWTQSYDTARRPGVKRSSDSSTKPAVQLGLRDSPRSLTTCGPATSSAGKPPSDGTSRR